MKSMRNGNYQILYMGNFFCGTSVDGMIDNQFHVNHSWIIFKLHYVCAEYLLWLCHPHQHISHYICNHVATYFTEMFTIVRYYLSHVTHINLRLSSWNGRNPQLLIQPLHILHVGVWLYIHFYSSVWISHTLLFQSTIHFNNYGMRSIIRYVVNV